MPAPRKLDSERMSLEDVVDEVQFTKLVVRNTPEAKALVAGTDKLHADAEALLGKERLLYTGLLDAEVKVAIANRGLDAWVLGFRGVVEAKTGGKPDAPLYRRFFGQYRPSEVIRMTLQTELGVVGPWVDSLKADADTELKSQGASLEKLVALGTAAVAAQKAARQAIKDHRTGAREALFEQVNSGRAGLFGELSNLSQEGAWIDSFFRSGARRSSEEPQELSVSDATRLLDSQRKALQAAEAALEAAKQREAAAQAAAAARESKEKERDTKRKEAEALRARLRELDEELK